MSHASPDVTTSRPLAAGQAARRSWSSSAAVIALVLAMLLLAGSWIASRFGTSPETFDPAASIGFRLVPLQRLAFLAFALATAATMALAFCSPSPPVWRLPFRPLLAAALMGALAAEILQTALAVGNLSGKRIAWALVPTIATAAACVLGMRAWPTLRRWVTPLFIGAGFLTFAAGLLLPISLPPAIATSLPFIEWHLDSIFGARNHFASGATPDTLRYGLLANLSLGLLDRWLGPFSIAGDLRIVQMFNIAYATLLIVFAWRWFRPLGWRMWLFLALALPWVSTIGYGVLFPNQSGFRFIFFALFMAAIAICSSLRSMAVALPFGALAGLSLLWNVETGVAVTAASGLFIVSGLRTMRLRDVVPAMLLFVCGIGSAVLATATLLIATQGHAQALMLIVKDFASKAGIGAGRAGGFAGGALLAMGLAAFWLITASARRRRGPLGPRLRVIVGLAALTLAWGPYYALQPHPWNVWSYIAPAAVMLLALARPPLGRAEERSSGARMFALAAIALLLLPGALGEQARSMRNLFTEARAAVLPGRGGERASASGMLVARGEQFPDGAKIAALKDLPSGTRVFAANSYMLPKLSGRHDIMASMDQAYFNLEKTALDRLAEALLRNPPPLIVFDDPQTIRQGSIPAIFQNELSRRISPQFASAEQRDGWMLFRPRTNRP